MRRTSKGNPFTDAFVKKEIDAYGAEPYNQNGIEVVLKAVVGRADDYLNVNFRISEDIRCPILMIDGQIWMSLTFMEIQSAYLPIKRAKGKVATGGLGMGYFTMRAAEKKSVTSVDVYEQDPRVVEYFTGRFGHTEWFKKVNIILGDVRQNMTGKVYDFVFMDVYQTLLPDELPQDYVDFPACNTIKKYHAWGEEKILLAAITNEIDCVIEQDESEYFALWMKTPLSKLRDVSITENYIEEVLEAMGRLR